MNSNRHFFIDNIKALGIILVVIGHIFPRNEVNVIYLFHMPLFFLLSGFLFQPQDARGFSLKKINRLLVPYVAFLLSLYLINSALDVFIYEKSLHDVYKGLSKLLYGGEKLKGDFGAFWFATVLFFSLIAFNYLACKFKTKTLLIVMIASYTLAFLTQYLAPDFRLPLGLNVCLYTMPLIGIGWFLKKHHTAFALTAAAGLALFFVNTFIFHRIDVVDLKSAAYGIPLESTVIAIAFFYFIIVICKKIPSSRPLAYIGKASMTIMFTHQWFHFNLQELGLSNIYALTALTLTLSLLVHALLERTYKCRRYFLGEPQATN